MTRPLPRLSPQILRELEGYDWEMRPGRRHWQIWIGDHMVTILSFGTQREGRIFPRTSNTCASIRRAVRRLGLQKGSQRRSPLR